MPLAPVALPPSPPPSGSEDNCYERRYHYQPSLHHFQGSHLHDGHFARQTHVGSSVYWDQSGRPTLPPMRNHNHQVADIGYQHAAQAQHHVATQQPAKEEKSVGGVSAKLDYDMELMTDFVCHSALRLVVPGSPVLTAFRKWVHHMLCATRLPSATILMSMYYLAERMSMLRGDVQHNVYPLLTVALVLGSKFLDDNTFVNRSWADVSQIKLAELNQLEKEWLRDIDFRLHHPSEKHLGWQSWSTHWQDFQKQASERANRPTKLSPLTPSMHRHSLNLNVNFNVGINQNKPLPPLPTIQGYNLNLPSIAPPAYHYAPKSAHPSSISGASFASYDQWRAANGDSPESAPTTGPTTPEYYGPVNPWSSSTEGYSRRTMFGFPPCAFQSQMQPVFSGPHQPDYSAPPPYSAYNTPSWSPNRGPHDYNCGCIACGAQRGYMNYGLLPQPVAG